MNTYVVTINSLNPVTIKADKMEFCPTNSGVVMFSTADKTVAYVCIMGGMTINQQNALAEAA